MILVTFLHKCSFHASQCKLKDNQIMLRIAVTYSQTVFIMFS